LKYLENFEKAGKFLKSWKILKNLENFERSEKFLKNLKNF